MAQRDLTKKQYHDALARRGIKPVGFMGYYEIGDSRLAVSVINCGLSASRRAKLAYLIRCQEDEAAKKEVSQ